MRPCGRAGHLRQISSKARRSLRSRFEASTTTEEPPSACSWPRRADYFAAGSLVVWDVDLFDKHVVKVYRSTNPDTFISFARGTRAEAEPALPGWSFPVDDLFPPAEKV